MLNFEYPQQVEEFIRRWFQPRNLTPQPPLLIKERGSQKGEELWTQLNQAERQRIQDLVKNPLCLALLCSTWQGSDKGLPETKAGLYQQFVEEVYKWKENCFFITEEKQEELNAALGRLAKRAIDQETSWFRLRHKLVREELGDAKQENSLFSLALKLGWLNQVGLAAESATKEKVYAFYHPTFEEYFAALAVDDWHEFLNHVPDNPTLGVYRIFAPQWKEVILLWLGCEDVGREEKEEFIQALVEFDDGCGNENFYGYRTYFLAAECIREFEHSTKADEIIKQIVNWSFGYLNSQKQGWVTFRTPILEESRILLEKINCHRVINVLAPLLDNSQYKGEARHEIIKTLANIGIGNPIAIKVLESIIKNKIKENKCCIEIAACGLVEIASGELRNTAIQLLISLLPNLDVVKYLGNIEIDSLNEDILNSIITAFTQHLKHKNIFSFAFESSVIAQALIKIISNDHPSYQYAINLLNEQLQFSESKIEAAIVAQSLKEFGVKSEEINNAIKEFQNEVDNDLNARLADLGLKLNSEIIKTINALIEIICKHKERHTRERAAWCLLVIVLELDKHLIPQPDLLFSIIKSLKYCFVTLLNRSDHRFYVISVGLKDPLDSCYSLIWHCAQSMPYPAFYQAWHQQEKVKEAE